MARSMGIASSTSSASMERASLVAVSRAYHATQAKHENVNILSAVCKHGYGMKDCCGILMIASSESLSTPTNGNPGTSTS